MLRSFLASLFYRATAIGPTSFGRDLPAKWLGLRHVGEFLRSREINVVIDVGANEGQFVTKLRRLGYGGLIVSFEPDPRPFALLQERFRRDPLWLGYQVGLGEVEAEATFHQAVNSVLSSFLTPIRPENTESNVRVTVHRLDRIFDKLIVGVKQPRVLLKTDTQGFDLQVLSGAQQVLPRLEGILVELSVLPIYDQSPPIDEALRAYRDAGFDLIDLSVVNRTPDGRILEFDGLYVRRP